jgi:hypothetical protein
MSEIGSDDLRLRATEEQMRRALGLRQGSSQVSSTSTPHTHRRHFARDGDVPVEILHGHDDNPRAYQLAALREALQAQNTVREEAERLLAEARQTIRDLQTKLGHERLAKEEAVRHVETVKREFEQAQQELKAEYDLHTRTPGERDQAIRGRQVAEDRVREAMDARRIETANQAKPPAAAAPEPRRRGRPPKVVQDDTEVVEWWKPGWKDKYL